MNSITQEYMLDHYQDTEEEMEEPEEIVLKKQTIDPIGGEALLVKDHEEYVIIVQNKRKGSEFYKEYFTSEDRAAAEKAFGHFIEPKI